MNSAFLNTNTEYQITATMSFLETWSQFMQRENPNTDRVRAIIETNSIGPDFRTRMQLTNSIDLIVELVVRLRMFNLRLDNTTMRAISHNVTTEINSEGPWHQVEALVGATNTLIGGFYR